MMEKVQYLTNIQNYSVIKTFSKLWSRRKIPNLTKCIYDKPTANITFNGLWSFSLIPWIRQRYELLSLRQIVYNGLNFFLNNFKNILEDKHHIIFSICWTVCLPLCKSFNRNFKSLSWLKDSPSHQCIY